MPNCEHSNRGNSCKICNPAICETCDQKFAGKSSLKRHYTSKKHQRKLDALKEKQESDTSPEIKNTYNDRCHGCGRSELCCNCCVADPEFYQPQPNYEYLLYREPSPRAEFGYYMMHLDSSDRYRLKIYD